jgi:hypothetical protein
MPPNSSSTDEPAIDPKDFSCRVKASSEVDDPDSLLLNLEPPRAKSVNFFARVDVLLIDPTLAGFHIAREASA